MKSYVKGLSSSGWWNLVSFLQHKRPLKTIFWPDDGLNRAEVKKTLFRDSSFCMQTYHAVFPKVRLTHTLQTYLPEPVVWLSRNVKLSKDRLRTTGPHLQIISTVTFALLYAFSAWIMEIKLNHKKKINHNHAELLSSDAIAAGNIKESPQTPWLRYNNAARTRKAITTGIITSFSDAFVVHAGSNIFC